MAIFRIFQRSAFDEEDTKRMGEAELALVALELDHLD